MGDATDKPFTTYNEQNKAMYFQSGEEAPTELAIEWFNQHGCGLADKNDANWINCQIVIQFMCQESGDTRMSNGLNTAKPRYTEPTGEETYVETLARRDTDFKEVPDTGNHESWESHDACFRRERNRGLFMADKNPGRTKGALRTRQNAGGGQNGLECSEERDYYPYWHPSEWTDIAVLTSEPTKCENMVANSGNRVVKHECVHFIDDDTVQGWSTANHKEACDIVEGTWIGFQMYKDIIGEDQVNYSVLKNVYIIIFRLHAKSLWSRTKTCVGLFHTYPAPDDTRRQWKSASCSTPNPSASFPRKCAPTIMAMMNLVPFRATNGHFRITKLPNSQKSALSEFDTTSQQTTTQMTSPPTKLRLIIRLLKSGQILSFLTKALISLLQSILLNLDVSFRTVLIFSR